MSKEIKKGNYPGFVTLIYQNGEVIFSDTRGYADIEDQIPLNEDSLFRIYSMTKPITGAALMVLVEQGKVSLSDPVEKYIPEFKETKVFNKKTKKFERLTRSITLLDLATHSSGLTYSFIDKGIIKEMILLRLFLNCLILLFSSLKRPFGDINDKIIPIPINK